MDPTWRGTERSVIGGQHRRGGTMFQGSWMIGAALLLLLHNPRETKKAAAVQEESSHNGDRWVCEYGVRIDEYLLHRLRTP